MAEAPWVKIPKPEAAAREVLPMNVVKTITRERILVFLNMISSHDRMVYICIGLKSDYNLD